MEPDRIPPCDNHIGPVVKDKVYCSSFCRGTGCKHYLGGLCAEPKED